MLDSYIIDSIRREERGREDGEGARLHLPLHDEASDADGREPECEDADRGVMIIPLDPEVPISRG